MFNHEWTKMHTKNSIKILHFRCLLGETVTAEPSFQVKSAESPRFYQKVDWACFGVTTFLALTVYWFTLALDVGLVDSGLYSTSSMYAGVADAPGFPIYTVFSWFFT